MGINSTAKTRVKQSVGPTYNKIKPLWVITFVYCKEKERGKKVNGVN